ncbi:hypothetical protein IFM89_005970 [Coptis chinensis]|uniref:PAS fold-2 domain-containing protein n=1 Tax=Coptis chinensis TaxID=261450 RepID=A0A835HCP4_9MAGN|nr:hypothetical protein IFM89_005970 [Coptis chinensis]
MECLSATGLTEEKFSNCLKRSFYMPVPPNFRIKTGGDDAKCSVCQNIVILLMPKNMMLINCQMRRPGRRIRELTSVVQKRFKFPKNSVELYAEKILRELRELQCLGTRMASYTFLKNLISSAKIDKKFKTSVINTKISSPSKTLSSPPHLPDSTPLVIAAGSVRDQIFVGDISMQYKSSGTTVDVKVDTCSNNTKGWFYSTFWSFACMLAIQERSLTVIAYSENTISLLGLDTQIFSDSLLGLDVRLLFTPASGVLLARAAASREISLVNPIWVHSRNTQRPFYAILHRIDVGIVVDLEPACSGDPAFTIAGVV